MMQENKQENMEKKEVKYITRYQKENTTQVNIRFNYKFDMPMINWMNSIEKELDIGKATYLKNLIKEDMKKRGIKLDE